jgi:Ca2+/Na+ antiporter
MDVLVQVLPLTHTFVGLTLACWGGNISDVINACVAAKNRQIEFVTSSIVGSQILNLQVALGLPWLVSVIIYDAPVVFNDESIYLTTAMAFLIAVLSVLVIVGNELQLSYCTGVQLILLYVVYCVVEYII